METLFRLVLNRPPVATDASAPNIRLAQNSDFQAALGKAHKNNDSRDELKEISRKFVATNKFVGDVDAVPIAEKLHVFNAALNTIELKKAVTNAELVQAVENAFGQDLNAVIKNKDLEASSVALKDSLIAIKMLPEEHARPIEALTRQLRDIEVILQLASEKEFPGKGSVLRRYRRRSVLLPTETELRSSLSNAVQQKAQEEKLKQLGENQTKLAQEKLERYQHIKKAVAELTSLSGELIQNSIQKENPGFMIPAALRPTQLFIKDMSKMEKITQLEFVRVQTALGKGVEAQKVDSQPYDMLEAKKIQSASLSANVKAIQSGTAAFTPNSLAEASFRLQPAAEKHLSAQTLSYFKANKLNISERPLDKLVEALDYEAQELSKELDSLLGRPMVRSFKRIGTAMVVTAMPKPSVWNNVVVNGNYILDDYTYIFDNRAPRTHGNVVPAGVADLLVIKQQLIRYEGADIAHIENVLKGERKEREHILRRETEEIIFRESEVTKTEERELESTSRFEMSRESSETIQEDASLKAGLSVSGKYGPVVEFSVSAEGSYSRSKQEATKSAASYSQDVTERSANKVAQRVLERSSLRVTNEVTDTNRHLLDNTGGGGNIAGVYQWVNKVYQAQMYNYGMRMMYDFMIPEPAAFLISNLQNTHASAVELVKPTPFTLRPDQISESNYHSWVQQYAASDVQPPPEIYRTKSMDFKAGNSDSNIDLNHSGQLQIDEGYQAIYGTVGCVKTIWEENYSVDVVLGARTHRFSYGDSWVWGITLKDERDSIPFALISKNIGVIAVAIEVKCQRTNRAMEKWRLETHAKLSQAYKARLSEYEEKLAALEMQAGVAINGKNPMLNLELMNDELKKHCVSILTEQNFELFDSINTGTYGVPQIDFYQNAAEGPYVRFFEQAFEWEQMTWHAYPYFWGRKNQWDERVSYEDVDLLFNQFLKAGYCRVSVPVRPGFEGAIDHFMSFGEVWDGGPLPAISNPLYLPIADEIAESLDRPGDEIPQGDPWLVRIPTTLVHLRADDTLPRWHQNADGDWVEIEEDE